MGFFSNISEKRQIKKFEKDYQLYQQQTRYIRVALYEMVINILMENPGQLDEEHIKFLSAQIINYYSGANIDNLINNFEEPSKSNGLSIKHLVIPIANEILKNNYKIREIIVYTLRMDIIYSSIYGETFEYQEKQLKEAILIKYGEEFLYEANVNLYNKLVDEFVTEFQNLTKNASLK